MILRDVDVEVLKGKTLVKVERFYNWARDSWNRGEALVFHCSDSKIYALYHSQSCCESVTIEDICGDLDDLIGTKILVAEERTSHDDKSIIPTGKKYIPELETWTFYEFATIKGSVTVRWCRDMRKETNKCCTA